LVFFEAITHVDSRIEAILYNLEQGGVFKLYPDSFIVLKGVDFIAEPRR